jgi:GNAT superfamily N-acetyltransferase
MGAVDTEVVDPNDEEHFAEWFAHVHETDAETDPSGAGWQRAELRAAALADAETRRALLAVRDGGGRIVGSGWVEWPLLDNRHLAEASLAVLAADRRRGAGRALLGAVEEIAAAEGRTTVVGFQLVRGPVDGPTPGRAFAERFGYEVVQVSPRRHLALPVDRARLEALEAESAPYAEGYRILGWTGAWPAEWLDDRVEFGVVMSTDVPRGGYDVTDQVWDAARVRATEALTETSDRDYLVTAALDERSGRLVGFSEIRVPRGAPQRVYQGDTLVLGAHRGHRLGMLMKLANLRQLADRWPSCREVVTHNASDNGPMIAVNDALGCTVPAHTLSWQRRLA